MAGRRRPLLLRAVCGQRWNVREARTVTREELVELFAGLRRLMESYETGGDGWAQIVETCRLVETEVYALGYPELTDEERWP